MSAPHLLRYLVATFLLLYGCGVEGVVTQTNTESVFTYALEDWGVVVEDKDKRVDASRISIATHAALQRFSQLHGESQQVIEEGLAKVSYTVKFLSTTEMAPYKMGVTITSSTSIVTMIDNTMSEKRILAVLTHEYLHALEEIIYHPVYTDYTVQAYHSRPGWFMYSCNGNTDCMLASLESQIRVATVLSLGL
jgi:hypothetical protein